MRLRIMAKCFIEIVLITCIEMCTSQMAMSNETYEISSKECARLYAERKLEDSAKCMELLIKTWPNVDDVYINKQFIVTIYMALQDYSKCVEWERNIIDDYQASEMIDWEYQNLALCYMYLGKVDKQIETYNEAIEKGFVMDGHNISALAGVYEGIGEYEKAREYYRMYLDEYPDSEQYDQGIFLIGELYFKEGNLKEAIKHFRMVPPGFKLRDVDYLPTAGEWDEKLEQDIWEMRNPGEIAIFVNDKLIITEVDPVMRNNRVLVPLRGVFEELGAVVTWVHEEKRVFAEKEDIKVNLKIGTRKPTVNGVEVEIDVPAMLIKNHTFIPLRFVSESLGASVRWEEETQTVYIDTK